MKPQTANAMNNNILRRIFRVGTELVISKKKPWFSNRLHKEGGG
jgi:hypothetical protein